MLKYLTKYITKEKRDERMFNKKKFFTAQGMFRPIKIQKQDLIETITNNYDFKELFKKQFSSNGLITDYKCLQLPQEKLNTLHTYLQLTQSLCLPSLSHYYPPTQQKLKL